MLMWWHSKTADIQVVNAPSTWGKRFWLELKTTEWRSGPRQQRHDLEVDLDQLDRYGQQAIPDYYVFTTPPCLGVLHPSSASAWLRGLAPELLAYQSWSAEKWFAEWTWVGPGWALRQALHAQIVALSSSANRRHRIAEIRTGDLTWVSPVTNSISLLPWKDFWNSMDQCGDKDWPAQFLLPPPELPLEIQLPAHSSPRRFASFHMSAKSSTSKSSILTKARTIRTPAAPTNRGHYRNSVGTTHPGHSWHSVNTRLCSQRSFQEGK